MTQSRQIIGYLAEDEKAELASYAAGFGLHLSSLALLLVRRELYRNRLGQLARDTQLIPLATSGPKVAARFPSAGTRAEFGRHVAAAGLKMTPALALLLRAELRERWLEGVVTQDST